MQTTGAQRRFVATLLGVALCVGRAAHADVTISSAATKNILCSNGVCSPTASDAVLNVSDLESLLASGNVTVKTKGSGGVQATNIVVDDALSWSNQSALGLDAYESIVIQKKVSVSAGGGLSFTTNDGGSGGEFWVVNSGRVVFQKLSSALSINGTSYKLVKTISKLATAIAKNPGGAYALSNDYDASENGTYASAPVSTLFTGVFEGLGNTISNLTIVANDSKHNRYMGLFSVTGESGAGGVIENLRLTKVSVKSSKNGSRTGGLVGSTDLTLLFNDHVSGRVSAAEGTSVGGLVGSSASDIVASHSSARVSGGKNSYVGGLVGVHGQGNIADSYATGAVSSKYIAGGLIGYNIGQVQACFATGRVFAGAMGGGLVGLNIGVLYDSYETGAVEGTGSSAWIGGLIGGNGGASVSSYSTGAVSELAGMLGGFVGEDDSGGGMTDSYWDLDTSGVSDPSRGAGNIANDPGITGLTTEQFQSGLPAGFDPNIWTEDSNINNGLPYLISNPPPK